jgi:hypothetical protein
MEKPYRAHILSSECIHHLYAKAPSLTYSFHELGNEASLVEIIEHVWDFIGHTVNQRNPQCQNIAELASTILEDWQQFLVREVL